ncbi:MAG TPA: type II toxin-antitoxin system ParD family antitoxin [Tepidisphaeraceae bacterium]|jgi:Arc/MetJ-type ribon-helix-helix transcriptional regulator|nr:type II toxin-antitoxin system ParD family antitoxin [Tepidisphaeraceae bacterium]
MTISAKTQKLIEKRMKRGGYRSAEDVLMAALASLEQQEQLGDFAASELNALMAKGEQSGKPLDGEQVLTELRELRKRKKKAG